MDRGGRYRLLAIDRVDETFCLYSPAVTLYPVPEPFSRLYALNLSLDRLIISSKDMSNSSLESGVIGGHAQMQGGCGSGRMSYRRFNAGDDELIFFLDSCRILTLVCSLVRLRHIRVLLVWLFKYRSSSDIHTIREILPCLLGGIMCAAHQFNSPAVRPAGSLKLQPTRMIVTVSLSDNRCAWSKRADKISH
ncbi:hypothetical protein AB1N83_010941 [Pleurotus pulmonarius]